MSEDDAESALSRAVTGPPEEAAAALEEEYERLSRALSSLEEE